MKLSLKALALTGAIVAAILTFILGIWHIATGYGTGIIGLLQDLYAGMIKIDFTRVAPIGEKLWKIGLLIVFTAVDGFILGIIGGFFYNLFVPAAKQVPALEAKTDPSTATNDTPISADKEEK